MEAYGGQCVWCSRDLSEDVASASADHVLCLSADGSNWLGNLLLSCKKCNRQRGDTPAELWLERCLAEGVKVKVRAVRSAIKRSLEDFRCQRSYLILASASAEEILEYQVDQRRKEALRRLRAAADEFLSPTHFHHALLRSHRLHGSLNYTRASR